MSTEHDETAPIATGVHAGDQPTTPIPRPGAARGEDATQVLGTSTGDARRPDEPAGTTRALPVGAPAARAEPDEGGRGPGSGATAVAAAPAPEDGGRGGRAPVRVSTVVWGLVVALVGVGFLAMAAGAQVDVELALIGLLALAGAGLLVGSVAAGVRRRR